MPRHRILQTATLATTLALLAFAGRARAGESPRLANESQYPEAVAHLDQGQNLDATGDYEGALAQFRAGYAIDPDPLFLLLIGQEERSLHQCDIAVQNYQNFLLNSKDPKLTAVAKRGLEKCNQAASQPAVVAQPARPVVIAAPATGAGVAPPAPGAAVAKEHVAPVAPVVPAAALLAAPIPAPSPNERPPWYTDVLGDALTGTGVAALLVGTVFLLQNRADVSASGNAPTSDAFVSDKSSAATDRIVSASGFVAGGLLVAAGLVRYELRARGDESTSVSAAPLPGGAAFGLAGSF